ncbi:MAG TPA: NUDIX hydrolase [Clostridiales bacterium]|nr:NUDIX hydrolase [Clostridiales bacterium]
MEIWDAYKSDGNKAGFDLYRDRPIPSGFYHTVSEVLVKHTDGSFLLMQRDWNKTGYPGVFEAGASGSILKGETPYQGAVRELKEETGIHSDDLTFIFAQSNMRNTFYYGFLCITDCPKDSIILQKGETISYRWLTKTEFLSFSYGTEFVAIQRDRWLPFLDRI